MKIVVAMDSFKGSVTSLEAGAAVKAGLLQADNQLTVEVASVADGGEGSLASLTSQLTGELATMATVDLLFRPITVQYFLVEKPVRKIFVESAEVIGLHLISPSEQTIRQGSSYGLGLLIRKLLVLNPVEIVIFLGGSGTVDGGLGFLQGLADVQVKKGNPLFNETLQLPAIPKIIPKIIGATDVTNPYCGTHGSVNIFSAQKGASQAQQQFLENRFNDLRQQVKAQTGIDLVEVSGSGAAGGLGGSIFYLSRHLENGFDVLAKETNLARKIQSADLVYTGEGSMDAQSYYGKLPMKVAELAGQKEIPVVALVGKRSANLGKLTPYFKGVFAIQLGVISLEEAIKKPQAKLGLQTVAYETYRLFKA